MYKRISYVLGAMALGISLNACDEETIEASDNVTERSYNVTGFTGIRVESAFKAFVTFSETEESIVVEASDNLHDKVVVEKEGDVLRFDLQKNTGVRGDIVLNVYITTGDLSYFQLDGVSDVTLVNRLVAPNAIIEASGSSNFNGEIQVDTLRMEVSGTSDIDLFGRAAFVKATMGESSDLKDYDLVIDHLDLMLRGGSESFLTVNESISINASGTSTLNYKGNPTISRQELSGIAKLVKKD